MSSLCESSSSSTHTEKKKTATEDVCQTRHLKTMKTEGKNKPFVKSSFILHSFIYLAGVCVNNHGLIIQRRLAQPEVRFTRFCFEMLVANQV